MASNQEAEERLKAALADRYAIEREIGAGGMATVYLAEDLKQHGVTDAYVCGLATDYCVKFTALDAVSLGFRTHLIVDACRGVELAPGDIERALAELESRGVALVHSEALS